MANYLCLLRSTSGTPQSSAKPSPAQMEEMYKMFNEWMTTFKPNIVDLGGKLTGKGKVATMTMTTDGPFVEGKEIVGGFMILSAETIERAMEIARDCPGVISPGTSLEVREIRTA